MIGRGLKIYIPDEVLRKAAEGIVEVTRQMTGDHTTDVDIDVAPLGMGGYYPTWGATYYTPQSGTITSTNNVSLTSNTSTNYWSTGTNTTTGYSQTYTTPYTVNIGSAGTPMTPDQVPSSDLFEQMLISSVKQLNEAYNLGRIHGYIQGKKHGGEEANKEISNALDCDPLTYAEVLSPDETTSSKAV